MKNRFLNLINLAIFISLIIIAFTTLAVANNILEREAAKDQVVFLSQTPMTTLPTNWFQKANLTRWQEHSYFFLLLIPLGALPNGFHLYGWSATSSSTLTALPIGSEFKATLLTAEISLEVILPAVFVWIGCCLIWDWWLIKRYRYLLFKGGQGLYRSLIKDYSADPATYFKTNT